ncbi:MAG TPA: D-alanyl-D-alanine carboxypeptidase family protein, partial [Actinomycetota bacterium]|nr:D-alanyl-D-alanine carboxypeptidase family protein [Actinomycetota bacterium]
ALNVDRGWRFEPAGVWMRENAWRFGFIESYPLGKEAVTCYDHEPWHYRYFGRELAAEIHASGITTREYLWREAGS